MSEIQSRERLTPVLITTYVCLVLVADTLVMRGSTWLIDWAGLSVRWRGMDLFKFVVWFVVPFAFALPALDKAYFGFGRWRGIDWVLLATIVGGGGLVMLLLPYIPGVGEYESYQGWGQQSADWRRTEVARQLLWTFSWLMGWEFMFRYWLVRSFRQAWPEKGWRGLLIAAPFMEGMYHVIQNKPALECLGMAVLSLAFCAWALHRRNSLLPFLGHLAIEIELIAFLYFSS